MKENLQPKFYTILVFLFVMISGNLWAQNNIAPLATTNCQGSGGVTPYCWNWNRINDKDLGSCNTQQAFIWTTSPVNGSEWMEFVWSRPYAIGSIQVFHAQTSGRFLTGGTIQKWNGSSWVDHHTFSGLSQSNCENTVKFPVFVGDRMRIAKFVAGTGQNSNLNYREIEIYDAPTGLTTGISFMSSPSNTCSSPQTINATLSNNGLVRIDSAIVNYTINGAAQSPFYYNMYPNFKLSDTLTTGGFKNITLNSSFTLNDYTDYNFVFWSSMPNGKADTVNADDTLKSVIKFLGSPKNPATTDVRRCGVGVVDLVATPGDSKDIVLWWNKSTGGSSIGEGHTIKSPFLYASDSFYAESVRGGQVSTHKNGFNGGTIVTATTNTYNGGMFDMTTGVSTLLLDSLSFRLWQNVPGATFELYYREGGFTGYTTDAAAWTKLASGAGKTYLATEGNILTVDNLKMILKPNTTYGFYFTTEPTTGNDIYLNNGNTAYNNGDMTLQGGTCLWGLFGSVGTYTVWSIDVRAGYRKTCPSSGRTKLNVEVVPLATGATLLEGSYFNGTYRTGTVGVPDYAAEGRTINYELRPPTKFSNSEFGTKWYISSLLMGTINGTPIPTGDTTMVMPGSTNGKLAYTPSWGWADSTIKITVNIFDISTGCDTVLVRYIFIAPTPLARFEAKNGCLGTPIEFVNTSLLSSGFMTYQWDFGDGTSSDFESPVHNYTKFGKYKVKLTCKSNLGISKDTIVEIEVFEIPDVKFDVTNQCEGVAVKFTSKTTISSGKLAWNWTFGDGQSSTIESPTHLYTKPGGYKVTLTATANGCSNSLTKNATQFAKPKANFNYTGECAFKEMVFNNTSTIALGEKIGTMWNFGDGDRGTVINNRHTFTSAGNKTVKLYAISQFGCTDSATKTVVVKPTPTANFTYDKVCDVDPVKFTNTTNVPGGITAIYNWSFGDGGSSTLKDPSYKYQNLGPKVITMTATGSNGCFTDIVKQVEVLVQPVANFTADNGCSGDPIQFVNKSKVSNGDMAFKWFFGDGDSSSLNAPVKVYNPSGAATYTAVLNVSVAGGCTDLITRQIEIRETPTCGFTAKMDPTNRAKWTFTPNNASYGAGAYTWIFEGSGLSTAVSPTHTFDYTDTRYRVLLNVRTPDGCDCIDSTNSITTSFGVGINNLTQGGLKIYPNPSNGKVTVEMADFMPSETATIRVMDATGREVYQTTGSNGIINLELTGLADGIYQVQVNRSGMTTTGRIMIRN